MIRSGIHNVLRLCLITLYRVDSDIEARICDLLDGVTRERRVSVRAPGYARCGCQGVVSIVTGGVVITSYRTRNHEDLPSIDVFVVSEAVGTRQVTYAHIVGSCNTLNGIVALDGVVSRHVPAYVDYIWRGSGRRG